MIDLTHADTLKKIADQMHQANADIAVLTAENTRLGKMNSELRDTLQKHNEEITRVVQENTRLAEEVKSQKTSNEQLYQMNLAANGEISRLNARIRLGFTEIRPCDLENENALWELRRRLGEADTLHVPNSGLPEYVSLRLSSLRETVAALRDTNTKVSNDREVLGTRIRDLNQSLKIVTSDLDALTSRIAAVKKNIEENLSYV